MKSDKLKEAGTSAAGGKGGGGGGTGVSPLGGALCDLAGWGEEGCHLRLACLEAHIAHKHSLGIVSRHACMPIAAGLLPLHTTHKSVRLVSHIHALC